jgi:hypothetical protein
LRELDGTDAGRHGGRDPGNRAGQDVAITRNTAGKLIWVIPLFVRQYKRTASR